MTGMRFHWRLLQGGDTWDSSRGTGWERNETSMPDIGPQTEYCKAAEDAGFDSLLTDVGFAKPDPVLLAAALGQRTERIRFIIAIRPGLMSPALFVQQLNTLSSLINGRFSLNVVIGSSAKELRGYGDFNSHDERYTRAEEYLAVCREFWSDRQPVNFDGKYFKVDGGHVNAPFVSDHETHPEFYIAGGSEAARSVALSQGSCWMMFAQPTGEIAPRVPELLKRGRTIGIRCTVFVAPTRQEAVDHAYSLIAGREREGALENSFVRSSDAESIQRNYQLAAETDWVTDYLFTGTLRAFGPAGIAIVGSYDEVAEALLEYKRAGVTQFILSSWPKFEQMVLFGNEVIPRVRDREASVDLPVAVETAGTG